MEGKKISQGEFNFRGYENIETALLNAKVAYERTIADPNNAQREQEQKHLDAINTMLENPEMMEIYDRFVVSNSIDGFVGMLTDQDGILSMKNKQIIFDDWQRKNRIAHANGLEPNDMGMFLTGKWSFELLEELYQMAGLEIPENKFSEYNDTKYYTKTGAVSFKEFVENYEVYYKNNAPGLMESQEKGGR